MHGGVGRVRLRQKAALRVDLYTQHTSSAKLSPGFGMGETPPD